MSAAAALLCCCGGGGVIPCEDLPTAVSVTWTGAGEVLYFPCETCETGSVYLIGSGTSPTSCSTVATLFSCQYIGQNVCEQENTLDAVLCDDLTPLGSVTFTVSASVNQPVANTTGPYAGFWTVGVEVTLAAITSGSDLVDLWECSDPTGTTCGLWGGNSYTFVGPPTSSSPIGTYSPPSGATWFDCVLATGASVTTDNVGSVTVT